MEQNHLAPGTDESLESLKDKICIPNLDDLLDYSNTLTQHVEDVRSVLKRLLALGLKLGSDKCHLLAGAEKQNLLKNIKDLWKLLGFLGYYKRYMQDFFFIVSHFSR